MRRRDTESYDRLEAESGNLLRIGNWLAEENEDEEILRLAGALWEESDFMRSRGFMQRGLSLLKKAQELSQASNDIEAEITWLLALVEIHILNGHLAKALSLYEQVQRLSQRCKNTKLNGDIQLEQGRLLLDTGELNEAISWFEQALQTYRKVFDNNGEVEALSALGETLSLLGKFDEAFTLLNNGLREAQSRLDRRGEVWLRSALGYVAAIAKDWTKVIFHLELAISIAKEIGDRFREVRGLHNLGEAWFELGNIKKSEAVLLEAVDRQKLIDDPITKAFTHFYLAKVYKTLNFHDACLIQLEQVFPFQQIPVLADLAAEAASIKAEIHLYKPNNY